MTDPCGQPSLRCLFTSLVMSNMDTRSFLKIGRRLSSALIMRRSFASWSPFRLMYSHSFLVLSVRGSGDDPTMAASCELGVIGFMNAGFGVRFFAAPPLLFFDALAFFAPPRLLEPPRPA